MAAMAPPNGNGFLQRIPLWRTVEMASSALITPAATRATVFAKA